MIKYQSCKQIAIEDFIQPFGGTLNKENRWVRLAHLLPWDDFVMVYSKRMSRNMGRKAIDPRIAIGALIIKHMLCTTDEDTIEFIKENPYLQYFLGFREYRYKQPFTPSLFVRIRERLGLEEFNRLTVHLMSQVHRIEQRMAAKQDDAPNPPRPSDPQGAPPERPESDRPEAGPGNKGHLMVDASVAPSDIRYPTDLDLLNAAREHSEGLIDGLYVAAKGKLKPRTYRQKARRDYLAAAQKRKKQTLSIRKAIRKQLGYLGRNLRTIARLLDRRDTLVFPLAHKHQRLYWIIQELYRQQKLMYDARSHQISGRIVSVFQPYIRPIVRGKSGREVEFGAKISVSLVDGYCNLDRLDWEAYNEGGDLPGQIEAFREQHGHYPEWVSADKIYATRANRAYMKERHIKFSGVPLGRRARKISPEAKAQDAERKMKSRQRSQVEGAFGVGKRKFDLALVKAKTRATSESWIGMVILVMNISRFMRQIFLSFLREGYLGFAKRITLKIMSLFGPVDGYARIQWATF